MKRYRGKDRDVVIPDSVREIGDSAFVDLSDDDQSYGQEMDI